MSENDSQIMFINLILRKMKQPYSYEKIYLQYKKLTQFQTTVTMLITNIHRDLD